MLELAAIGAGLIANIITKYVKPKETAGFTQEDLDARKMLIRGINLAFGALMLVFGAWLLGEPLDVTSLTGTLEALLSLVLTFTFSQGTYLLTKKG